jgi:hypothetical protein
LFRWLQKGASGVPFPVFLLRCPPIHSSGIPEIDRGLFRSPRQCEHNPAEVDRLASDLIELCTRHNFAYWLAMGAIHRGWARSASGNTAEGIPWIDQGIRDFRATGAVLALPLKAEALHLACLMVALGIRGTLL